MRFLSIITLITSTSAQWTHCTRSFSNGDIKICPEENNIFQVNNAYLSKPKDPLGELFYNINLEGYCNENIPEGSIKYRTYNSILPAADFIWPLTLDNPKGLSAGNCTIISHYAFANEDLPIGRNIIDVTIKSLDNKPVVQFQMIYRNQ